MSAADEATLKRILSNRSVEGVIVTNGERQLQYTSLDHNVTFSIASKLFSFGDIARLTIRDIDPEDDLLTFRIRTREKEMMVIMPNDGAKVIGIQKLNLPSSPLLKKQQNDDEYSENFAKDDLKKQ